MNRHAFRLVLISLSYKSFISVAFGAMAAIREAIVSARLIARAARV